MRDVAIRYFVVSILSLLNAVAFGGPAKKAPLTPGSVQTKNLNTHLKRFLEKPHPAASPEQHLYAHSVLQYLKALKLKVSSETFSADTPARVNGKVTKKQREFENIVATREGTDTCAIVFGGHYDTKDIKDFVGANDGGSSTALLLELARVIAHEGKAAKGTWGSCDVSILLFDGEEAFLEDWDISEALIQIVDHLYGSRDFASRHKNRLLNGKPIRVAVILDMIGHKEQNLIVTKDSDETVTQQILRHLQKTKIALSPLAVDDDHRPLLDMGIPVVHMIDWTNLSEWHTPRDRFDILSPQKIADLGNGLVAFLREEPHG